MGFFYTNITLKGPTQEHVTSYLRAQGRTAFVSPTIDDVTVVYDRACEDQDQAVLDILSAGLSNALRCPALWALLHDGDVFEYALYDRGKRIDAYNSEPSYFGGSGDAAQPPRGGDAQALCAAFGASHAIARVDALLRQWWNGQDEKGIDADIGAEARHRAVAEALGLPPYAYGMGYHSIGFGNVPSGADVALLTRIER